MQANRKSRNSGFTLLELIVVIVILGILMTTVSVGYMKWVDHARVAKVQSDYEMVKTAVKTYRTVKGAYPRSIEDLLQEGHLEVEEGQKFVDPWGREYDVQIREGKLTFKSFGADGTEGGGDDVVNGKAEGQDLGGTN